MWTNTLRTFYAYFNANVKAKIWKDFDIFPSNFGDVEGRPLVQRIPRTEFSFVSEVFVVKHNLSRESNCMILCWESWF